MERFLYIRIPEYEILIKVQTGGYYERRVCKESLQQIVEQPKFRVTGVGGVECQVHTDNVCPGRQAATTTSGAWQ